MDPAEHHLGDQEFVKAVWGAIGCTGRTRPAAWTMTGWAHRVDGAPDPARDCLRRALDLDPDTDEAALIMASLPPG